MHCFKGPQVLDAECQVLKDGTSFSRLGSGNFPCSFEYSKLFFARIGNTYYKKAGFARIQRWNAVLFRYIFLIGCSGFGSSRFGPEE
jgi:hypothetical protein